MKLIKILTIFGLLFVIGFIAACSTTGDIVKDTATQDTNTAEQSTTDQSTQNTQSTQEQTGCQYDNPKCDGGYACVNNQCTKIASGGHSGGGGGSSDVASDGGDTQLINQKLNCSGDFKEYNISYNIENNQCITAPDNKSYLCENNTLSEVDSCPSPICGDIYKMEKAGNKFNIGQTLYDIDPSITDTELDLLRDNVLNDNQGENTGNYSYTQTIFFTNSSTGKLVFDTDDSDTKEGNPADTYLKFSDAINAWAWNYSLKFINPPIQVKDSSDLEGNKLIILGKEYTITNVTMSNTSYGDVDKLILVDGNGRQIILENNRKANVNNEDVDESYVKINNYNLEGKHGLKEIIVSYQPEDNLWLLRGESIEDPIFNAFNINFEGLSTTNISNTKIDIVGNKINLVMNNKNGDLLEETVCYYDTKWNKTVFGYDRTHLLAIGNEYTYNGSGLEISNLRDMKGMRFLYSLDGVSHIIEIVNIDTINDKVDFKILDTGELYKDLNYSDGTPTTFGDINNNLTLTFSEAGISITFDNINNDKNEAYIGKYGEKLIFRSGYSDEEESFTYCSFEFAETNTNVEQEVSLNNLKIVFAYDSSINKIKFKYSGVQALPGINLRKTDDNSMYNYVGRTQYGTSIEMNQFEDGDLSMYYPENTITANIYVNGCH